MAMTGRPLDINTLLDTLSANKDKQIDEDIYAEVPRLKKPTFLTKGERSNGLKHLNNKNKRLFNYNDEDKIETDYNQIKILKKKSTIDSSLQHTNIEKNNVTNNVQRSIKKKKFNFDWDENDDTFNDYQPIIPFKNLYQNNKRNNNKNSTTFDKLNLIEQNYIGKSWEAKDLDDMSERDWKTMREKFNIKIKNNGNNNNSNKNFELINPMRNWNELKLIPTDLLQILTDTLNFKEPTPIQRITIPNLITSNSKKNESTNKKLSKDFVGVSTTGSGKTLAFIIPILIKLLNLNWRPHSIKLLDGPQVLVLVPTRELALQIQTEIEKISKVWQDGNCQVLSIIGGMPMEEISLNLKKGCDILIATPGRLIDCLENHMTRINMINTLVLDEADKMIDLGFEDQLKNILNQINLNNTTNKVHTVQKLLFTATLSPVIESIANGYLSNPTYVMVGVNNDYKPRIKQIVQWAQDDNDKFNYLNANILPNFNAPIIIFIKYKTTADWLASKFKQETNFKYTILHGSKSQEQRQHSLQLLKSGKADIMIATNVAARGLDIPNVSLVINFQMSSNFDDYIHRIGRTGRAGKTGCAITLVNDQEDQKLMLQLYKYVKDNDTLEGNEFSSKVKEIYSLGKKSFDNIIF